MAKATIENFKTWLRHIGKFASSNNIERTRDEGQADGDGGYEFKYGVRIYTDNNSYSITARETSGNRGYLGCIASARKPRAGETWTRGNDLADGPLTKATWHKILADIVSYELVQVHKSRPAYMPDVPRTDEEVNVGPSLGEDGDESTCTTEDNTDPSLGEPDIPEEEECQSPE